MSDIILGIVIGITLALILTYVYIRSLVRKVIGEIDSKIKSTLMPVIVERHNDQIYCYSQEDKQFLCQGNTVTELREAMNARFPDKTAYLAGGDEDLVKELQTQLKEVTIEISSSK